MTPLSPWDLTENFATRFPAKILNTVVFRILRSASSSHTVSCQSLLIAACTHLTFSRVLLVAGFRESRSLSTGSWSSLKLLCNNFICTALIASYLSLLNHPNSFQRNVQAWRKIWCRFVALLAQCEFNGHTVHMLTQLHLGPPLTSTVKSSLFTHAHSSPLFLAARLYQCCANSPCY